MEEGSAAAHHQPPVYTSSNSVQAGATHYISPVKPQQQQSPPASSYSTIPHITYSSASQTAAKPLCTTVQSSMQATQRAAVTTGAYAAAQQPSTYYQPQAATTTMQPLYTSQPSYSHGANYSSYPAPGYGTYAAAQNMAPSTTTYTSVQPATYAGPSYVSSIGGGTYTGNPVSYQQHHHVGGALHSYVSQGKIYAPQNAELVPAGSQLRGDMYALYDTAAVPTFEAPLTFEGPSKHANNQRQDNNATQQVRVTTRGGGAGSNLPARSHAAKKREKRCCGC